MSVSKSSLACFQQEQTYSLLYPSQSSVLGLPGPIFDACSSEENTSSFFLGRPHESLHLSSSPHRRWSETTDLLQLGQSSGNLFTVVTHPVSSGWHQQQKRAQTVEAVLANFGLPPPGTKRLYRAQAATHLLNALQNEGLSLKAGRDYTYSDFARSQPAMYFHENLGACAEWAWRKYGSEASVLVCDLPHGFNYNQLCSANESFYEPEKLWQWQQLIKAHRNRFDHLGMEKYRGLELIRGRLMGSYDARRCWNIDFRLATECDWDAWTPAPDSRRPVMQLCFRDNFPLSRLIVQGVVVLPIAE